MTSYMGLIKQGFNKTINGSKKRKRIQGFQGENDMGRNDQLILLVSRS